MSTCHNFITEGFAVLKTSIGHTYSKSFVPPSIRFQWDVSFALIRQSICPSIISHVSNLPPSIHPFVFNDVSYSRPSANLKDVVTGTRYPGLVWTTVCLV